MTQKLSAEQRGVLLLVGRSVARDDGWVFVSSQVWPAVQQAATPTELLESLSDEDGRAYVRLTKTGRVVLDWLC